MALTHWSMPSASSPLHDTTEREQKSHSSPYNGLNPPHFFSRKLRLRSFAAHQSRALGVGPEQREPEQSRGDHDGCIDGKARHVAVEHAAGILDHVTHDIGSDDAGERIER